jgi:hypothetical protein
VSLLALAGYCLLDQLPAAWAIDSDPTNLGAEGLTLDLRLYQWDGVEWAPVDSSGVTPVELGDGDYLFTGLPLATGLERYRLIVATAGDPASGLREYVYGARPGERITWRGAIALPDQPRLFKVGDTAGSVSLTIESGLPSTIGDGATTATARLLAIPTSTVVFTGRAATISGVVFHQPTASWGATLSYDVAALDFAVAGLHRAEFLVCYLGDPEECHTLPADNILELHVRDQLGGPPS